ncbi:unnamed protein product, partial [Thlaspi arvense]
KTSSEVSSPIPLPFTIRAFLASWLCSPFFIFCLIISVFFVFVSTKTQSSVLQDMEKLSSESPDDLLLKILSFLPTKVAVSTSVLSKRWEFLWMDLSVLEYDDSILPKDRNDRLWKCNMMRPFIGRNMSLHRAPVIESFRINFNTAPFEPEDIKFWVANAVFCCVRELSINYSLNSIDRPIAYLPSSLYVCESLVSLKLEGRILVDVPRVAYIPSLKILSLRRVTYKVESILERLVYYCPVLEDLVVEESGDLEALVVISPSLQRLTLEIDIECYSYGIVINTPSLEYFKVTDNWNSDGEAYIPSYFIGIEDMHKLEEAYMDSKFFSIGDFLNKLTTPVTYDIIGEGIAFNQLEHLKLCSCQTDLSDLLIRLLEESPNLLELEIYRRYEHDPSEEPSVCWENSDPQCFLRSLQTFKWTSFGGSKNEIELVKYILRNACCLKTATILGLSSHDPKKKLEVMEELSLSSRGSTSCQLEFFCKVLNYYH